MKTRSLLSVLIFMVSGVAVAQNNVGIGTQTPHASAQLDVSSTTKGLLAPRMTTAQRNAIAAPAKGLLVYDIEVNSLFHYNGSAWANLSAGGGGGGVFANTGGTVHNTGNQATDHFIFGRATMPTNAEMLWDSMFFFNKAKGAFRVGGILNNSTVWRPDSIGRFSFAAGNTNKAKGESSTALGGLHSVTGKYSFAGGYANNITGDFSTALGDQNTVSGEASFALGSSNQVLSHLTFVTGIFNTGRAMYSTIFGNNNLTVGEKSFVSGESSRATGQLATAFGQGLVARSMGSFVVGRYNDSIISSLPNTIVSADPLFIIGNGTGDLARKNAVTVLKNGNVGIGTNTPVAPLTVIGVGGKGIIQKNETVEVGFYTSSNSAYLQTYSNHPLYFSTNNGDPQMTLNNTGLAVGFNNNQLPTTKLDVNGNLRLRSTVFVNVENLWGKHIRLDNDEAGLENGLIIYDGFMKFRNMKSGSGFTFYNSANSAVATINSNGNMVITGTLTSSDARLKKDIRHIENPMEVLDQLNGYHYYWKEDWRAPERQSGLLAQEVEKVLPELVGEDENGIKAVNYTAMIPYLLEAVKEIKAENEKLKHEISKLKKGKN